MVLLKDLYHLALLSGLLWMHVNVNHDYGPPSYPTTILQMRIRANWLPVGLF